MKLKETLNLGKTSFPMRAGLPNKSGKKSGKKRKCINVVKS